MSGLNQFAMNLVLLIIASCDLTDRGYELS